MKKTSLPIFSVVDPLDEDIRAYAYHLYEQSGCMGGRDLDNWLEAKACILANIPSRTSHMRLHQHLHDSRTTAIPARGFTMPASDAALPGEGQTDPNAAIPVVVVDVTARKSRHGRKQNDRSTKIP